MKKLLSLIIFLGLTFTSLYGEENSAVDVCQPSNLIIDPLCLPVDINIDVVKSQKEIIEAFKTAATTWPASEKEEAETLINQINSNINIYIENLKNKPKAIAERYNPLSKYTLTEVVHLYHLTQQSSNSLIVLKETLIKIERAISDTEILKAQLRKEYIKMDASPKRGILGLKIFYFWTSLLSYNIQKSQEIAQIQLESDNLKALEEFLDNAVDQLAGSDENVKEMASKVLVAEADWKKSQEILQQHNMVLLRNKVENSEDEKFKAQEMISLEIDEASAHLDYVYLLIKDSLERLLMNPKAENIEEEDNHAHEWNKLLTDYEAKIHHWTENTLAQFHRSIDDISIAEEELPQNKKETYKKFTALAQTNQILLLKLEAGIKNARFLLTLLQDNIASIQGGSAAWGHQFISTLDEVYEKIRELSVIPLFIISGITITPVDLLTFAIIILGSLWLSRVIFAALTHFSAHRKGVKKSLIYRMHRLIHYAILTLGFFIGLSMIGFDFSSFLLVAGALGVGIGFGLQGIANNFISGIIILFESYLNIGDIIELQSGQKGEILEINFRSTTIRTFDGTDLLIPNSELINHPVTNWTLADLYRRIHVPFSTANGVDKEFVSKIIEEGAKELPNTICKPMKPNPNVDLVKLGANGLEFELVVWVEVRAATRTATAMSDYLWMIDTTLAKNQIKIPSSQVDVRIIPKKSPDSL